MLKAKVIQGSVDTAMQGKKMKRNVEKNNVRKVKARLNICEVN